MHQPTTEPRPTRKPARVALRQYYRHLALLALGVVALVIVVIVLTVGRGAAETSIISNVMLITLMICPLMICGAVLYAVMLAAIFGITRAERTGKRRLRQLGAATQSVAEQTATASDKLSRQSIRIGSRFASLDRAFDRDRPDQPKPDADK